jgi:hypothetical protein
MGMQGGIAGVHEVVLHQNQQTRTIGESLFNVGAATILTGAFGAIAARTPKSEFDNLINAVNKDLDAPPIATVKPPESSTAGAAQVGHGTSLEDEGLADGAGVFARVGRFVSPLLRVLNSPSKEARVLAQRLVDIVPLLKKNERGIATATSAETLIRNMWRQRVVRTRNVLNAEFKAHVSENPSTSLSRRQFNEEVARAGRNGDNSAIPQVRNVTREIRKFLDEDRKFLQDHGVLPEDFKLVGAESYIPRVYNVDKIKGELGQFKQVLRDWFRRNPVTEKEIAEATAAGQDINTLKARSMDPLEIEQRVNDTVNNILGTTKGMSTVGRGAPRAKPLRTRELDVPDNVLEPWLHNDIEDIMTSYFKTIAPQIQMRRVFGDVSIAIERQKVIDDYGVKLTAATSNKEAAALTDQMEKDLIHIDRLYERVMGITGQTNAGTAMFVRTTRFIRAVNYMKGLGSMAVSSLSDVGRVMVRFGIPKTLGTIAKFLGNSNFRNMSLEDLQRMGTAMDWFHDSRGMTLADFGSDIPAHTKWDRGMRTTTNLFTRATLMASWNTFIKSIGSIMEQDAILRAVRRGSSMPKLIRTKLAANGIGEAELVRIAPMIERYAIQEGGVFRAQTDLWTDRTAAEIFEGAITRNADALTTIHGAGDLPMIMDAETAKTLLQFKTFAMTSVSRMMIPVAQGISRGDPKAISGAAVMLFMGATSYYIREKVAARTPDLSMGNLAMQSLNWSGMLGFLPDIYDPLVATPLGLPKFAGNQFSADLSNIIGGPTFGTINDAYNAFAKGAPEGDSWWTQKRLHRMRKLLPYQNLWYFRRILDAIEGTVGQATGAEGAPVESFVEQVAKVAEPPEPAEFEVKTPLKVAAVAIGAVALALLARKGVGALTPFGKAAAEGAEGMGGATPMRIVGVESPTAAKIPVGKATTNPELAPSYMRIQSTLSKMGLSKEALVGANVMRVEASAFVGILDKIIPKDDPYRILVNKLKDADLPGNVYFGRAQHMYDATKGSKSSLQMYGAYFENGFPHRGIAGTDHILINLDMTQPHQLGWVMMHELTHAGTVRNLREDTVAFDMLESLLDRAKTHEGMPMEHYAYENVFEFVAESFGNLEFQQALKKADLWNEFLNVISMTFGIAGAGLMVLEHAVEIPETENTTI